jgi:hypothetical protein
VLAASELVGGVMGLWIFRALQDTAESEAARK